MNRVTYAIQALMAVKFKPSVLVGVQTTVLVTKDSYCMEFHCFHDCDDDFTSKCFYFHVKMLSFHRSNHS